MHRGKALGLLHAQKLTRYAGWLRCGARREAYAGSECWIHSSSDFSFPDWRCIPGIGIESKPALTIAATR